MTTKSRKVTSTAIAEMNRRLLRHFAEKYGGDCTLNELRVLNQILISSLKGKTCCVTAIHVATGIPIPTVSRAVANLQNDGWLSEQPDPNDGRKRLISMNPNS
jgi:DNA-binding MarR family transcriptional regulator